MEGKKMANESFTSNIAGMSKSQLYDIMSQMKILVEQNQEQARQILVDNPGMTRALFQAQVMLGMVNPPQVMPNIQQASSQAPQQSVQPVQPSSVQAKPLPVQASQQEAGQGQIQIPARKQQPSHPVSSMAPAAVQPVPNHQSQAMPSHSQQSMQPSKGHMNAQGISMSHPQSQVHTMPPHQHHSAQQPPSFHQTKGPNIASQPQQPLHSSGAQHHPLQPPLPPQPRPPSMQPFQHQHHPQMGPHVGFQTSGPPQSHISQPSFIGNRHPANIGFPQGQPPMPNQPPPQSLYQGGGSHMSTDFNHQGGGSMQMDRPSWMPGPPENSAGGSQLPGPPPLPGQMGPVGQPPRPPPLTHEMEKALLQQVMSLTPEQINLLPPEQRHQVFQLQQMLR